jgi:hypothetical protein
MIIHRLFAIYKCFSLLVQCRATRENILTTSLTTHAGGARSMTAERGLCRRSKNALFLNRLKLCNLC